MSVRKRLARLSDELPAALEKAEECAAIESLREAVAGGVDVRLTASEARELLCFCDRSLRLRPSCDR